MSADEPRRADQPDYPKPGLRPVKSPEAPPRPAPDPALKAVHDDMKRRHRGRRERLDRGPDDRDAA